MDLLAVRILCFVAGAALVVGAVLSAIRTCVLPRAIPTVLARTVFLTTHRLVRALAGRNAPYERRDRVLAYDGPMSLFVLLATWLVMVFGGYFLMFLGAGVEPREALFASGSSLFTLGFSEPISVRTTVLVFSEAALGLMMLALLITFLPSLYGAFSRRELQVTKLGVRAGQPPWGVKMMLLAQDLGWLEDPEKIAQRWVAYQDWFADIAETHQSFPVLAYFRSPQPDRSWITATGAVLDGACLRTTVIDGPRDIEAAFCLDTGILAVHEIAHYFRIPHDHDVTIVDAISVTRAEFDGAYAQMADAGIPLKARDEAWEAFARGRARYDGMVVMLCRMLDAPVAPWTSDRDATAWQPSLDPHSRTHVHRDGGEG
jgi:hypothetical protein